MFIGALGALMTVSALAVVAGRSCCGGSRCTCCTTSGAGVCLVLALVTGYELVA